MSHSWGRRLGAAMVVILLLSVLIVPAASASTCQPVYYVVQRGDTLLRIAARFGVSMQAIMAANAIPNPNVIYAGRRLVIPICGIPPPPPPGPPPGPGCSTHYRVRQGDNLTRIAYRYGTTVASLQRCNGIPNPNRIYVGQVLCICGAWYPPLPPGPHPPRPLGAWKAWYFNSVDLSGAPVLHRTEANLNWNWGYGSPARQVYADFFSARWQRTFNLSGCTWRVTVRSDDGVRVSIGSTLVIDAWAVQAATTHQQDVIVSPGNHLVTVEYFENDGLAEIQFSMVKQAIVVPP